jgi:hypothetical protein
MRLLTAALPAVVLAVSCGGGSDRGYVPSAGYVRIEDVRAELTNSSAGLRNTPSPVHFAGVPMPATLRVQLAGGSGSDRTSVSFELPCGPEGDFFAGREVIPASVVVEAHGTTSFPPREAYPSFRASISANPLLADSLEYSLEVLFQKGGLEYECVSSGEVVVTTGSEYSSGNLPAYPPWDPGDTLFFSGAGEIFDVKAGAAWIDSSIRPPVARLMLFADSVPPADLTKPEGTRLQTCVPLQMLDGRPVPAGFSCSIRGLDTVLVSDTRFGWVAADLSDGRIAGSMAFIDNGGAAETGFRGGGTFDIKVRR